MSVRVLVVDDSGFFRKRIAEILGSVSGIEVIDTASNGKEGLEKVKALKPDVVTMDYEMPVMDGVTAVRHIMAERPTPILMFSSLTYEGARVTLDALEAGAVDFLPKNFEDISRNSSRMQEVLKQRILQVARSRTGGSAGFRSEPVASSTGGESETKSAPAASTSAERFPSAGSGSQAVRSQSPVRATRSSPNVRQSTGQRTAAPRKQGVGKVDLLLIGTSTGGPVALQKIMSRLPANLPVPILLVQHMPATFTPAFAERLNSMSPLQVAQASDGAVLRPGCALLAPGGKQMLLARKGANLTTSIIDGDERLTYKPSVDLTFGSAARAAPGKCLAIVLTGMGADGREGCRMLKAGGSTIWTQSEKSCVVYGMPAAVDKAGYSDLSLDVNDIADQIISELM